MEDPSQRLDERGAHVGVAEPPWISTAMVNRIRPAVVAASSTDFVWHCRARIIGISALREDPEPQDQGRSFRLDDGRTAHLATFFDVVARSDLVLVWLVEEIDGEGVLTLRALEHAG